jgi:hypothetical protein
MVSRDLVKVLKERYPAEPATGEFLDEVRQFAPLLELRHLRRTRAS